ncbi:FkbM family methyltransferase [Robbsia sp. Bb-Pol-6]|uniref:FkbM family methyltransferase n=1 Tax=Robbsia betulipollinis TaxID=2981849 RepID=A0ABT3ZM05_9BURK|nr:FkbM family methyltransferase [Robbsia betulipollinis]MCY0387564.1 FkbM family methyltransferase [Robbsia betulipollinis]
MLSYAQIFEDVYLERCFANKKQGFYIDLGACHPVVSNTAYHFYQRGWHGINVEPTPFRLKELQAARPRDINLGVAIGRRNDRAYFNISANADHLSSLLKQESDLIERHAAHIESIAVDVLTLATLCERHAPASIDFLKIDVEGAEADVIAGGDWARWRPAVVVVEATLPGLPTPAWDGWEPDLLRAGYHFAFFDGINRYYVAQEHAALAEHFKTPVNPFDGAVALNSYGFALDDARHPDHAWAKVFAQRVFGAASIESADHLVRLMTWDLLDGELNAPTTVAGITLAFERILARPPGAHDIQYWENRADLPLVRLYQELLKGEEFRVHRSRISARSMWR